ncbi:very large A-kinase anchor protein-like [Cyrtonyx montezumae]|uniref:very large A-kinase anchor protein-like n=1 Tax=Cyrtonyx montezumae TaxID=9017 RepID=UPI0032DBA5B5
MSGGGSRRRAGPSWPSAFSRFFARSPPRQEAAAPGRPAGAHSSENKGSEAINLKSNQKESTTLPALLKVYPNEEKNHSTEELSRFDIPEELKKANSLPSLTPGNKAADKDKQPREGFFQFLGSLFNLATKSSLVDSKPSACQDEPNRCEKDLQNRNTLTEGTQQQYPKTEKPVCSTPRIKEDSVNKDDMIFNNIEKDNSQDEQGGRKRSADVKMQIQRKPQAPAVTYATYRGSARIRQLLKSQSEMTEKGEEGTDNRNASVVKENGEIQTVVSPKSEHVTKENGEDEGKDHEDVIVNSSTVKMELKKSGEAQHYLDSNKHEITPNASASSTGSPSEVDLKHTPIIEADKVKRTYSQESLLLSSRNSKIPTNSTHQIADALKMSAVDSSFGKEYIRLGEAECYFLMDKKAASNCEKEIQCSDHSYQESTEKMQDGCLQSPKSNDKINEELQLSKEEYCCNDQIDKHSQITSNVQMLHSNTILQQQADEHTGCANKDSDPRKSDAQKMVAAAEREQNPQNFLARVLLPVNEQTCTSLSVESRGEECVATGNLTASKLTVENDKDTVMDQVTCNEELNALRKPMHVRNEHQLNHVKNSKDTATPQPGCLEKMKVMSEVAVENFAHGLCTHGCENMKSNLDELTAPLSVSFESSLETDDCYSASLHPDYKSVNKNIVKREVGSKDKRDAVSTPDLECEKSKSLEPIDMSLSENSIPTSGTISHKTAQDIPERTLVTLVEDNIPKPAPCPLVSTERIDDSTLAASKISEASMNEMALAPFESKNCISELSSHISKSQEKNQEISHSALKCKGNPLTDHFSVISEKDIDVDIISASPPSCEDRHIHISSEVEYNNKHGISSTGNNP